MSLKYYYTYIIHSYNYNNYRKQRKFEVTNVSGEFGGFAYFTKLNSSKPNICL